MDTMVEGICPCLQEIILAMKCRQIVYNTEGCTGDVTLECQKHQVFMYLWTFDTVKRG